jgi:hypothetical protein
MTDDLNKSVVSLHIERLQEQLAAMTARALRAEAIEREVCEGRHVYLQHEMDEVAQRALKAEEERNMAKRELSELRLCYSRTVDPGEHQALAAQNAALQKALSDALYEIENVWNNTMAVSMVRKMGVEHGIEILREALAAHGATSDITDKRTVS